MPPHKQANRARARGLLHFADAERRGKRGVELPQEQRGAVSAPDVGVLEHAQGLLHGKEWVVVGEGCIIRTRCRPCVQYAPEQGAPRRGGGMIGLQLAFRHDEGGFRRLVRLCMCVVLSIPDAILHLQCR